MAPRFSTRPANATGEHGFTMIEVLVSAVLLVVGVLALLSVLDVANATTTTVRGRDVATNLTRQLTEGARSIPYSALTPETIESQLQAQPDLAGQEGADGWSIHRRSISFATSATVCVVDDPSDGTGVHDQGVYCADSAAPGGADNNPDDYKRVTVDLTWTIEHQVHRLHQVAVVNNPGSAGGPAIIDLTVTPPHGPRITADVSAVAFGAKTSTSAKAVTFSVDGVPTATAHGSATVWDFVWPIAELVDGTHLVTAQAFDNEGVSGATRSITMTLNRFVPQAPTGLAGGRNGATVELEWLPNPERDIAGYRAYRGVPGAAQLVCGLTRQTTCTDDAPPAGPLTYFVVADDLDPGGEYRDGLPTPPIAVLTSNHAPNAPQQLTASGAGGQTTLTWNAPSPADVDGDAIAFYRIYRDGTGRSDRYDRTGAGTELSIVDGKTDGTPHEYWVTAVDPQLAESAPAGPVTM